MKPIPYGKQEITESDINAVIKTLTSDFLTQGPKVKEFEEKFAAYVGSQFAVAVSNGTTALHLAVLSLGLQPRKRIITSPLTFVASANCALYAGGDVEFADIDPATLCIDPVIVENKIKSSPNDYQGIVAVSFAGYPAPLEALRKIAAKYNLWIIEDACHAPGAEYLDENSRWLKTGNGKHANISVFSFHPVKHIACGEGGMLTTNDKEIYEKLLLLRSHGITRNPEQFVNSSHGGWYYEMVELGFNYRLPDILCALGISQLSRIEENLSKRRDLARKYAEELSNLPIKLPIVPEDVKHAYHLFVIQTEKRSELYEHLKAKNIFTQVHYLPVHMQPYYVSRYGKQTFANTEKYYNGCLSLPLYHSLTSEEQSYVISSIREFYE